MEPQRAPEPVFGKINPVIVSLAFVIGGLELLFLADEQGWIGGSGGIASRRYAIVDYAFWTQEFNAMFSDGKFDSTALVSFVTYPLIHFSFTHAIISTVFVLAIGNLISRVFGAFGLLLVFFAPAAVGALAYGLTSNSSFPLAGATPAVYGFLGAFAAIILDNIDRDRSSHSFKLLSIPVFLLALPTVSNIFLGDAEVWKADIAGFVTGFIATGILKLGGVKSIVRLLRAINKRNK